jgi:hypothetical protein
VIAAGLVTYPGRATPAFKPRAALRDRVRWLGSAAAGGCRYSPAMSDPATRAQPNIVRLGASAVRGLSLALFTGPVAGFVLGRRVVRAGRGLLITAEQVPKLMARVMAIIEAIEVLVLQVQAVTSAADQVLARVESTRAGAALAVDNVMTLQAEVATFVDALQPLLSAFTEIDPQLVRAVTGLTDRLQPLLTALTKVDADTPVEVAQLLHRTMPLMAEMRAAVPDVREILPVVQRLEPVMVDVETRIAGLPGASHLLRRGERKIEEAGSTD